MGRQRRYFLCWQLLLTCLGKCSAFTAPPVFAVPQKDGRKTQVEMMSPGGILFGAVGLGVLSLRVVSQGNEAIVERLGKFHRALGPGLHVLIPLIDQIRLRVSKREQVFDIPPQQCITSDNAPLAADAVVYWSIVNAKLATYAVEDLRLAIQNLVLTQLRAEIGKLTLDMTFSAREQVNSVLLEDLDVATKPWGVKMSRVEVRDIIPSPDIMNALESQMAAERNKRAVVIKSEGEKARSINEAEGDAQSRLIDAKADAEALEIQAKAEAAKIQVLAEGTVEALTRITEKTGSVEKATEFLLMRDYIQTQQKLATSKNAKVILSNDSMSDSFVKAMSLSEVIRDSK